MGRDLLAPIWCWWPTRTGTKCPAPAGERTEHPGYGPCWVHEPLDMRRAWRYAVVMARELDVSPWDALLLAVRVAAARVTWVDEQLRSVTAATDGDPTDVRVLELLRQSRAERRLMAQSAKAAIDAGVAERLVRQVELEGRVLADALDAALAAVGASPDARLNALEAAHRTLAATVDPESGVFGVSAPRSAPNAPGRDVQAVDDGRGAQSATEDDRPDDRPDDREDGA